MAKKKSKNSVDQKEQKVREEEIKIDIEDIKTDSEVQSEEEESNEQAQEPKTPEEEILELKNNHIRLLAEFDNYRKRTRKEQADLIKYSSERVLKALLPVVDDLDRTLIVMEKSDNLASIKEGIKMVHEHMMRKLAKEGMEMIEAVDQEFDTEFHEAITKIPVDDEKKGKVVDVVEKGYKLKEKVIRYAKVVIGE